ncbi:hypothetical protein B0H13DRAFT_1880295 [Mycena leptocephala]|nr:hypothetical protein B0H13DRAFT_1880295 [Mycena leptocephala]
MVGFFGHKYRDAASSAAVFPTSHHSMQFYLPLLALALTFLIGTNAIPTAESNHAARDLNMAIDGDSAALGKNAPPPVQICVASLVATVTLATAKQSAGGAALSPMYAT